MKKIVKRMYVLLAGSVLMLGAGMFQSCNDDDDNPATEKNVHIVGTESASGTSVATYWNNGKSIALSDSELSSIASAVAFTDNVVYIAGTETNESGIDIAMLWSINENGEVDAQTLTNGTKPATATSITVLGADVYVAGFEEYGTTNFVNIPKFWKIDQSGNITSVSLTNGTNEAFAYSIVASGNFLYVGGLERIQEGQNAPKYWKANLQNNQIETIPLSNGIPSGSVSGIAVSGDVVHLVGYEKNASNQYIAKYWKVNNGQIYSVALTTQATNSNAMAIMINESVVYITGTEWNNNNTYSGQYWTINGAGDMDIIKIPNCSQANSLVMSNSMVYIAGNDVNDNNTNSLVKYWKADVNDNLKTVQVTSSNGYSGANSIFVSN